MSARVTYHYFDNPAQEAEARAALTPDLDLLPWWARTVRVERYNTPSDERHTAAEVRCLPHYRQVLVCLYHEFFDNPPDKQAHMLRHELLHALLAPLTDWVRQTVLPLFKDNPALQQILEKEHEERMEGVVEDLAVTLGFQAPPTEPAP